MEKQKKDKNMVEYNRNYIEGGIMSLGISDRLHHELVKACADEKLCNVLVQIVEEIYSHSESRFQQIFEEKQDILALSICDKMREVFTTKNDLAATEAILRQKIAEVFAEIANEKQYIANIRSELKQEISEIGIKITEGRTEAVQTKTELKQDIAKIEALFTKERADNELLRKEIRWIAIGLAIAMFVLQPSVFEFISKILGKH